MRRAALLFWMLVGVAVLLACAPQPTSTPTPVPTATVAPEAVTPAVAVNYCLECHSDKEALIQTAKPEEKAPSESEGVG